MRAARAKFDRRSLTHSPTENCLRSSFVRRSFVVRHCVVVCHRLSSFVVRHCVVVGQRSSSLLLLFVRAMACTCLRRRFGWVLLHVVRLFIVRFGSELVSVLKNSFCS